MIHTTRSSTRDPASTPHGTVTVAQTPSGATRLHASGQFDIANHEQISAVVRTALAHGHRTIELDFAEVTFIDAATVSALLRCQRLAAQVGGTLQILSPSGTSARVLDVTGNRKTLCCPDEPSTVDASTTVAARPPDAPHPSRPALDRLRAEPCREVAATSELLVARARELTRQTRETISAIRARREQQANKRQSLA